jgi:2-keto-3-deoxy-L-rhamnonate aldolase RhmA
MKESFASKLKRGRPVIGTMLSFEAPEVAEMLSACGYDWLFIDLEHGPASVLSMQRMLQVIPDTCSAIVRIPENSPVWIKKVLDTGCDGIIVPLVNTPDEARTAVQAAKYPPLGTRGVGIARAHGYGMQFAEYVKAANDHIAVIIQIEHVEAVRNIEAILAVPGIDGVQIGPYDLSGSMNRLGEVASEPVQAMLGQIKQACRAKSIPVSMFVLSQEDAVKEIKDGCQFIVMGVDAMFLWRAAQNALQFVRDSSG